MKVDLASKTALITGASGTLGMHFSRLLAREGATVLMTSRQQDSMDAVCSEIEEAGGVARTFLMDVTDSAAIGHVLDAHEGNIDILINNAGMAVDKPVLELDEDGWDSVVDTNLKGAFLVSQAVARRMIARGHGGSIVNIGSILGFRSAGNVSAYAASKSGLIQLTKAMALELARHNIRVNALCPGYIETDLNREFFASPAGAALTNRIPQRRLGQPEDLDGSLLLLCSHLSQYITGTALTVDGGHLVSTL